MSYSRVIVAVAALSIVAGCNRPAQQEAATGDVDNAAEAVAGSDDTADKTLDWEGYYHAGNRWLFLNQFDGKMLFDLQDGTQHRNGEMHWDHGGPAAVLTAAGYSQPIVVGERVVAIGKDQSGEKLAQVDDYAGGSEQLFVDPKFVTTKGTTIQFPAIINNQPAVNGVKSYTASVTIDCTGNTFSLSGASGHAGDFAMGAAAGPVANISAHAFRGEDDVLGQAADRYCPD